MEGLLSLFLKKTSESNLAIAGALRGQVGTNSPSLTPGLLFFLIFVILFGLIFQGGMGHGLWDRLVIIS